MQKKLIALAIAGLSTAAFAQSNVTISGQMKVGMQSVKADGAVGGVNYTSRTRVVDDNSNIRFSGQENLGNGLTAWFQIESAIGTADNDGTTGTAPGSSRSTSWGTRNTAVGLKGAWGNVFMGKWDAHYNAMYNVEANGLTDGLAMASSSLNLLHTFNGQGGLGGRLNNVVAYALPDINGFTGHIAYAGSGGATNEWTTPNLGNKEDGWNLRLAYDNGPISAAYSHLRVNNNGAGAAGAASNVCVNATTGAITMAAACPAGTSGVATAVTTAGAVVGNDVKSNRLGFAYTFPMGLKVGLIYDKTTIDLKAAGTSNDRSVWALPIRYTTGAHAVSFTYAKADSVKGSGAMNVAGTDTGAKMSQISYEYALSKRTSVSATYVKLDNDNGGRYDFWHPANNVSGAGGLAGAQAGADPQMVSFGIRHVF